MKLDTITNKAISENGINPNDEFYTPDYAIKPLLNHLWKGNNILCPFDTLESNYYKVLSEAGFDVDCSHISTGKDFFNLTKGDVDKYHYIISNPPYSLKFEVFEKLFELGKPFAMLVGVVGLFESKKRFDLFRSNDFEIMYVDKRISYFKSYDDQKPSLNPPFSSVYICHKVLPEKLMFANIYK